MNLGRALVMALAVTTGCEAGQAASEPLEASSSSSTASSSTASSVIAPRASQDAPPRPRPPEWKRLADAWVYPNAIPNFELTNQEGESFRLRDIGDGYLLVGLIFTSCSVETACPLTIQKMFEVGKLWKAVEAAGKTKDRKLRLLTLTFDPENDTPAVLKTYAEAMLREVPSWTFATGPVELMEETLPTMFGILAKDDPKAGKAHTVKAALLGPGLQAREEWKDNRFEPQAVIDQVLE